MSDYIIRRLVGLVPLLLGISVISFAVIHLAPGKPTDLSTQMNPKVSMEVRERLEKLYGLDQPLHVQYWRWLSRIVRADFGRSFLDDRPVTEKIVERMPITVLINVLAMLLILLMAIPIGVSSAVYRDSIYDRLMTFLVFIGFATPTFWVALLFMSWFGVQLGWLPVSGIKSLDFARMTLSEQIMDVAHHLLLPVMLSAFTGLASISRYMRGNMLDVLRQDYITAARAKGVHERVVLYRHALRNAILPIVTLMGFWVPALLGGSVIFEQIFSIPGMGKLFYDAVMARDYAVVMGMLVIGATLTLVGNLLADIAYAYVDPRIRIDRAQVH